MLVRLQPRRLIYCGGSRAGTGRRLLTAPTQVRFLPPQPCALGRAAEVPGFQPGEAGSTPAGHSNSFGDRLTAGCRALNPVMQVQILLPEPFRLLRGRLTVGRDALNVLVLVRFQPPQLNERKSSGRMRSLSRKQVR